MSLFDLTLLAILSAAAARTVLRAMEPGMLLHYWMTVLERMNTTQSPQWQRIISRPLGYCGFCFAFWVAFGFVLAMGGALVSAALVSLAAVAIFEHLE